MTRPIAALILLALAFASAVPQAQAWHRHFYRVTPYGMRTSTLHHGPLGFRTVYRSNAYGPYGRYIGRRTIVRGPLGLRMRRHF